MNYIVEPFLIYLAGVADIVRDVLGVVGFVGGIIIFLSMIAISADENDDEKRFIKPATIGLIICAVMILAMMLIPDEETIYAIIVAKLATRENVEISVEVLKSLVDYIASVCA